jgi:hypothetical protein
MPSSSHVLAARSPHVWLLLAYVVLAATPAAAQPLGDTIAVPIGTADVSKAISATSMFEAELFNAHLALVSLHDARDRFTARSRPPQMATDSDVDVLAREAREAIEHVAFGRTAAAQKSVREVIARAERTLESLNRETATARQILDTCLSLVRSTLQAGNRELALEQATRCRRLVPDLAPSEVAHPANVVGVLAEADNLLRRMRTGRLHVSSAPVSNCSVYLNGRHLGTTPFQLDRAAAGEYRVQVECGRSVGRVHVVQLGDQPVSLVVDTQFDRAIVSDPRLLLRYERAQDAREQAVAHAVQLGNQAGVDDVLLVSVVGDRAELMRVHVQQGRLVGRASVPWSERHGFAQPALERAIVALSEARLEGEPTLEGAPELPAAPHEASAQTSANVAARPPSAAASPAPSGAEEPSVPGAQPAAERPVWRSSRTHALRWAGYGLLAGAGALAATGIALEWRAQLLRDDLTALSVEPDAVAMDPALAKRHGDTQRSWELAADLRWLGLGGSALATAAAVLLVTPRSHVPWWSYAIGAAGVALAAAGGQQISADADCKLYASSDEGRGGCRRERDTAARGVFMLSAAVPFMAVPITHALRRAGAREVALSPDVDKSSAMLTLRIGL